eukprot:TRINITY_DN1888_c0_g1_i1.p1 TRINITY_DN1888_c0_g1~~TRINITY_DN1888_c0_g1_i1.p1  ORF type:complete len:317 (-),score=47.29 TRINITY_DN1888_c0_g1_i1:6-956(-)
MLSLISSTTRVSSSIRRTLYHHRPFLLGYHENNRSRSYSTSSSSFIEAPHNNHTSPDIQNDSSPTRGGKKTTDGDEVKQKEPVKTTAKLKEEISELMESFPFSDPGAFCETVKRGDFTGKIHMFLLDFESTGVSRYISSKVIDIGAAHIIRDGDHVKISDDRFYQLLDPGCVSSIYAFNYHKILRSETRGKPSFKDVFPKLKQWVTEKAQVTDNDACVFLMNHFARMEQMTLANEFTEDLKVPDNWYFADGSSIFVPRRPLAEIYKELFNREPKKKNRANYDVDILGKCISKSVSDYSSLEQSVLSILSQPVTRYI